MSRLVLGKKRYSVSFRLVLFVVFAYASNIIVPSQPGLSLFSLGTAYAQTSSYSFPEDHNPHASAATESWQLLLRFQTQAGTHYAMRITLLRTALESVRGAAPKASSLWAFDQIYVLASSLSDLDAHTTSAQNTIARAALGLAGYDSGSGRVWLNQHTLQITAAGSCAVKLVLSLGVAEHWLKITLRQKHCAGIRLTHSEDLLEGYSQLLSIDSGRLDEQVITSGQAWLLRNWGNTRVPVSGVAPVVTDQFYLFLADNSLLEFSRSRRRDGSGLPVLSSVLHRPSAQQRLDYRALSLQDESDWSGVASGNRYAGQWTVAWQQAGKTSESQGLSSASMELLPGKHAARQSPGQLPQAMLLLSEDQWFGVVKATVSAPRGEYNTFGFSQLSPVVRGGN